jgi:hypothetical protein
MRNETLPLILLFLLLSAAASAQDASDVMPDAEQQDPSADASGPISPPPPASSISP